MYALTLQNRPRTINAQYQHPFLSAWGEGGEGVQSQILKRGDQKKMSAWGDLKTPCHGYLPGGAYYVSYQKKTFKNKIWLCV